MKRLIPVLLVFALVSCKSKEKAAPSIQGISNEKRLPQSEEVIQAEAPPQETENLGVVLDPNFDGNAEIRPVNIESLDLNSDTLTIQVNYSGGCQNHEFSLVHNGSYMESMPPQLEIYLVHNNNQDVCRARIQANLKFDLKSLRYGQKGKLVLRLNNYEEEIVYKY